MFAVLLISFLAVVQSGRDVPCATDGSEAAIEWSELICEHCKCNNIRGRRDGYEVTSRQVCEDNAIAAGQDYYNYMVDGPTVKICAYSDSTVAAAESKSSEESCEASGVGAGSRVFVGGVPGTDQAADKAAGITKSDWKIYRVRYECRPDTCASPVSSILHEQSKCTGLSHIQFRQNIVYKDTFELCGEAAHAEGFGYFSYRLDKKYCYYGEHHSSPYKCEADKIVTTGSDQWGIYTVDCA